VQVHDDDVRLELERAGDRLASVRRLADDLGVVDRGQEGPEAVAEERVVVSEQDSKRVRDASTRRDARNDYGESCLVKYG
jgi:hypothetical protein